jgi:hypothetical protein
MVLTHLVKNISVRVHVVNCYLLQSPNIAILVKINPVHSFPSYPSTIRFNIIRFEVLAAVLKKSSNSVIQRREVCSKSVISQKIEHFSLILSSHLCSDLPNDLFLPFDFSQQKPARLSVMKWVWIEGFMFRQLCKI